MENLVALIDSFDTQEQDNAIVSNLTRAIQGQYPDAYVSRFHPFDDNDTRAFLIGFDEVRHAYDVYACLRRSKNFCRIFALRSIVFKVKSSA